MSQSWIYPVEVRHEEGDYHAYSAAYPGAIASGPTETDALREMGFALAAVTSNLMKRNQPLVPTGEAMPHETHRVALPAALAAKCAVYAAWQASGLTKTALAERLGRSETEVRRILDPAHGTRLDQLEEAAAALGGRLVVTLEAA